MEPNYMFEFDWKYALSKLLIFLTSTKNIALVVGYIVAVTGFGLSPELQALVAVIATSLMAILKAWEDVSDRQIL